MINSIISFKKIPFEKIDNTKIVKEYSIPVKDNQGYDYFVRINPDYEKDKFETSIDTIGFDNVAKNKFAVDFKNKEIKNAGMDVWKTADRGKGLGVVMHLNNVMELMENDLKAIKLYSMADAVFFHAKCKFKPDLKDQEDVIDTLFAISKKDYSKYPELEEVVNLAGEYFDEVYYTSGRHCRDKEKLDYANMIVQKYLDIMTSKRLSQQEKLEYGFAKGFDMILTKERIVENKEFFNNLFKKYNIDYEIKDPQ